MQTTFLMLYVTLSRGEACLALTIRPFLPLR